MSAERDQALRWLELATQDLAMVDQALSLDPPVLGPALFHSQQAAEKALKGLIANSGAVPPRTHGLQTLWDLAGPPLGAPPDGLERLSDYAVDPRYPSTEDEYVIEDAKSAQALAGTVVARVREVLE